MKRYGYIIKEVVEPGILEASFDYVLRGTMRKTSRSGRYLINHKDEVIANGVWVAKGLFPFVSSIDPDLQ